MHRKTFSLTVLSAVAGALLTVSSVGAAALTYNRADLIIGFTAPGAANSYLINIGQFSLYRNATQPITLSIGNILPDLNSAFGVDWNADETVQWGVFGTTRTSTIAGDSAHTLYATRTAGSLPYQRRLTAQQATTGTFINDMGLAYAENGTNNSTANSTVGYLQNNEGAGNVFVRYVENGVAFSAFDGALANFGAGTSAAGLDLYRLAPGTGDGELIGTFSITQNGAITFTPVPEPGTVALLLIAGVIAFFVIRRPQVRSMES